jgi:uncharacterized protein YbbC (DUF1343 family)
VNYWTKHRNTSIKASALVIVLLSCAHAAPEPDGGAGSTVASRPSAETTSRSAPVRPGITVLLEDSSHLIRDRRISLITNQTGIDEKGRTDIDLLASSERARAVNARLVALYAPEHGIRGTEDRAVDSSVDERTGLPIHSLYKAGTSGPADSTLVGVDALVFDLQDVGTRTWTYVGVMIYSLRSAKRNGIPIIVLDRPNPVNGTQVDGPVLDATIANAHESVRGKPGLAWALWPFPLRHGMTMGEMARFYNDTLGIGAELHVMPAAGWRRHQWLDETGLSWVKPSPNIPLLESALLYPAVVAFEATTISVGRGTPLAHRLVGAPGLDTKALAAALEDRELPGVRFREITFDGTNYGSQQPYKGMTLPGVEIVITDRNRIQVGRLGAAIVSALVKTNPNVFAIRDTLRFDRLFGTGRARRALLAGDDPDSVLDRELPDVLTFNRVTRRYHMYR